VEIKVIFTQISIQDGSGKMQSLIRRTDARGSSDIYRTCMWRISL